MEASLTHYPSLHGSACDTFPQSRAGCVSAASSSPSTRRLKNSKRGQHTPPSLAGGPAKSYSVKPTKLLRTWTEGRKIPSTSVTFNKRLHKREPAPLPTDEDDDEDETLSVLGLDDEEQEIEDEWGRDDAELERLTSNQFAAQETSQGSNQWNLNCQHFNRCSGCVLETALHQPPIFQDAQKYFRCHGIHNLQLKTGNPWGWRCRAKLAVRGLPANPVVGLYAEGTHDVVDIPHCRTHHPKINAAVELLKAGMMELGIWPYDEDTGTGQLRYVQMSVTTYNTAIPIEERYTNGKVQVVLVWNDRSEQSSSGTQLKALSEYMWRKGGAKSADPIIHSVWANFQTSRTNIIFGGRWRHLLGDQHCWERIGGVDVYLTPASFSQANHEAMESMLRKIQKFVKPGQSVVELYAGSGIIGLSLAATCACRAVRCVEVNKEAKTSFDLSLLRFSGLNKSRISWHCADVSVGPINWLKGADVVVVDPPRKGLDAAVIAALQMASSREDAKNVLPSKEPLDRIEKRPWILRAQQASVEAATEYGDRELRWPNTLIYISCGWESFKQDCSDLVKDGSWHLFAGHAFNFFPGTDSIELLAIFKRGKRMQTKKKVSPSKRAVLERKRQKKVSKRMLSSGGLNP